MLGAALPAGKGAEGLLAAQVLLTLHDTEERQNYLNARTTLEKLLELGTVPVIHENDTVATHEIRFGDNDRLAALVAHLVHADVLVLLSDVDALYDGPPSRAGTSRVPLVRGPDDLKNVRIRGSGTGPGTGGMTTKIEAAGIAAAGGITTMDEVRALLAMDIHVALGMAIYTGRLRLEELASLH